MEVPCRRDPRGVLLDARGVDLLEVPTRPPEEGLGAREGRLRLVESTEKGQRNDAQERDAVARRIDPRGFVEGRERLFQAPQVHDGVRPDDVGFRVARLQLDGLLRIARGSDRVTQIQT
jgi:hypothetical protein